MADNTMRVKRRLSFDLIEFLTTKSTNTAGLTPTALAPPSTPKHKHVTDVTKRDTQCDYTRCDHIRFRTTGSKPVLRP